MRKIIHIDMDCFYAAVEMRDNPEYKNVPLAVGGDGPRSVLCTCNYLARKYGVRSAMPAIKAKQLCPDLLIVSGRMDVYKSISHQIREIFLRYTAKIEPLSLDEAFLDVSDCTQHQGSATLIAQEIRAAIYDELQLTASAGVAPNKFLAKIASDENKPNGQCVISPAKVADFVEQLPLKKIPGIGPKTNEKLAVHGFRTCADVRKTSAESLVPIVGKFAQRIHEYSFGEDDREVVSSRERKSVAVERTFATDLTAFDECEDVAAMLYDKLQRRYEPHKNKNMTKQGVKIKFADFTQTTVEHQSHSPIFEEYIELLRTAVARGEGKPIRLVGLTIGFGSSITKVEESKLQLELPM
ncbi:DNA polymerase IV [Thalassotalea atypica]|uniref:DNA polymerase IV n=1 Tax=Thalassotalea atypica TaxID=2054316 RepID=UPI0025734D1F|nr:DNA polymerase IV [Thalassotalea atypica]